MSHFFEKGFSVREPAWHGLAQVLEDYPGREKAMELAGHDFKINEKSVYINLGKSKAKIDGWKALVRDDTGHIVNVAKDTYNVVQNDILWDIIDAVVDQPNIKYETAGVLKQGAILWVLARIDEPSQVKGDNSPIYPYVAVATAHDGTGATTASCVSIRIICWNTYDAAKAESTRSGLEYKFKHTKNVMNRIEQAQAALGLAKKQHQEFMDLANELAAIDVTEENIKDFLAQFVPEPPANVLTDRVKKNIDDARFQVYDILKGNTGTIPEAHYNTAYGLWQSGIEFVDHYRRSHTPETYFRRNVLDPLPIKKKIAKLAMKVAG
jgi:phage/plasmid-like protein (TIGR03299 family)